MRSTRDCGFYLSVGICTGCCICTRCKGRGERFISAQTNHAFSILKTAVCAPFVIMAFVTHFCTMFGALLRVMVDKKMNILCTLLCYSKQQGSCENLTPSKDEE